MVLTWPTVVVSSTPSDANLLLATNCTQSSGANDGIGNNEVPCTHEDVGIITVGTRDGVPGVLSGIIEV